MTEPLIHTDLTKLRAALQADPEQPDMSVPQVPERPQIPTEDIVAYVAAVLGGQPFRKTYELPQEQGTITFRELATPAERCLLDWADRLAAEGTLCTQGQYERYLDYARMLASLEGWHIPPQAPVSLDLTLCKPEDVPVLISRWEGTTEEPGPLFSAGRERLIESYWRKFDYLVRALELEGPDFFWPAAKST